MRCNLHHCSRVLDLTVPVHFNVRLRGCRHIVPLSVAVVHYRLVRQGGCGAMAVLGLMDQILEAGHVRVHLRPAKNPEHGRLSRTLAHGSPGRIDNVKIGIGGIGDSGTSDLHFLSRRLIGVLMGVHYNRTI